MPSSEGIYNHGLFDMIYDLAMLSSELMNMAIGHAEDNVYPITIINAPQGEASKFLNKLRVAHEMRQAGKKGYVVNEYSATAPGLSTTASTITTQSLFQEWQALYETFTREVARLGINLDEIDRGPNVTASQIIAEEESANAFVKQIMEYNASEAEFAADLTMNFISSFVEPTNTSSINMTTIYENEGVQIRGNKFTLGQISEELQRYNYFVKVNARSGAIPSNIYQQTQITRLLQLTPPGTPAYLKLVEQFAKLNDRDLRAEEFGAMQEIPSELKLSPEVAETERARVNPRTPQLQPAL
jgi:hypothetical protein